MGVQYVDGVTRHIMTELPIYNKFAIAFNHLTYIYASGIRGVPHFNKLAIGGSTKNI